MKTRVAICLAATIATAIAAGCSSASAPTAAPSLAPIATVAASLPPAGLSIDAHGESPESFFMPDKIDVKAGEILRVVDVGDTLHDFTVDVGGAVPTKPADQHIAFQIKVDLLNKTNQAAIDLPPGTYHFYCSVSLGNGAGHAVNGMVGTITVH
jgi:plastocyanin